MKFIHKQITKSWKSAEVYIWGIAFILLISLGISNRLPRVIVLGLASLLFAFIVSDCRKRWFLFVFSLPLEVVSYYYNFTIKLWMVVLFAVVCIWIIEILSGKVKILKNPLNILLPLLLLVNILSSFNAIILMRAIRMIVQYSILYCVALYIANNIRSEKDINNVFKYIVISSLIVCVYGIFQFISGIYGGNIKLPIENFSTYNPEFGIFLINWWVIINGVAVPRIRATFGDPNIFGGYVLSVFPLIASITLFNIVNKRKYLVLLTISVVIIFSGFTTYSRSVMGGMFLACSVILCFWYKELFKGYIIKIALKMVFVILIMFMVIPNKVRRAINPLMFSGRLIQTLQLGNKETSQAGDEETLQAKDESTGQHTRLGIAAINMFKKHPIIGVGIGNYGAHLIPGSRGTAMSHSAFLSFFAETGIIGAIVNLGFIIFLVFYLVVNIKNMKKYSFYYALNVGLLASYIAVVSANIVYHYYNQAYIWFLVGYIIAVVEINKKNISKEYSREL